MIVTATIGGVAGNYMLRSTNGTSFTATLISNVFPQSIVTSQIPTITYQNNTWTAIFYPTTTPFQLYQPAQICYKSTNDGVTWTKMPQPALPSPVTGYTFLPVQQLYANGQYVTQFVGYNGTNYYTYYSTSSNFFSANYAGLMQAYYEYDYNLSQKTFPRYVRVK